MRHFSTVIAPGVYFGPVSNDSPLFSLAHPTGVHPEMSFRRKLTSLKARVAVGAPQPVD